MVSIPRPTLGPLVGGVAVGGGQSPLGTPPHDASPVSPKSWEESLLELDSDLQRICGSPSPASSTLSLYRPSQNSPPIETTLLSPDSESRPLCRRTRSHESAGRPRTQSQGGRPVSLVSAPVSPKPTYLLRSQSYAPGHGTSARPLQVRREETSKKLAEKLSRICGPGTLHESLNLKMLPETHQKRSDVLPLHTSVFRRASLKNGFKHQIAVPGANITDLSVMITDSRRLCVKSLTSAEGSVLAEVDLPPSLGLRHLMCYMLGDELCIRERSRPLWSESEHAGPQYVPILQEGEYTNDLRVVIRVPEAIRHRDLIVRTVDDSLIIAQKRSSGSGEPYEVSLVLPDMGNSLGVQASLSHHNQLYIVVFFDMC